MYFYCATYACTKVKVCSWLKRGGESAVFPLLVKAGNLGMDVSFKPKSWPRKMNVPIRLMTQEEKPPHVNHKAKVGHINLDALGQSELYARLNCLHGAKSSPLAAMHLK